MNHEKRNQRERALSSRDYNTNRERQDRQANQTLSLWQVFSRYIGKPTETGCTEWSGPYFPNGYAKFYHAGTPRYAYRVAWELQAGRTATNFEQTCGNKRCVNHRHVKPGLTE